MPTITISYRREDSDAITGRIFERLSGVYGRESLFRDIDNIPAGVDFRERLSAVLHRSDILIAVIGPKWLGRVRGGRSRINEETDFVRMEVETALQIGIPAIPVLIGNTRMPNAAQLPASLKGFVFRNAVRVDTGIDFDNHMDRLIRELNRILEGDNQEGKAPLGEVTSPLAVVPIDPPGERDSGSFTLDLRKALLTLLILAPLFLSVLLVPSTNLYVLLWLNDAIGSVNSTVLTIAGLLFLAGHAMWVAGRPARDSPEPGRLPQRPGARVQRKFIYFVLLPICVGAGFLAAFTAWLPTTPDALRWGILLLRDHDGEVFYPFIYPMGIGVILYTLAWVIGFFSSGSLAELFRITTSRRHAIAPLAEMICYGLSGAVAGAIVALDIALYQHLSGLAETPDAPQLVAFLFHGYNRIYMLIAAGMPWTMIAFLTSDLLFTGLTKDADPKSSARAAGYIGATAIGWLCLAGIQFYGAPASTEWILAIGGVSGLAIILVRSSAKPTSALVGASEQSWVTTLLKTATGIFILAVAILLSKFSRVVLDSVVGALGATEDNAVRAAIAIGACAALGGVGALAMYWVNVNQLPLHDLYRDVLSMALPGAARASHRIAEPDSTKLQ